jgi:hypothetical protein
MLHPALVKEIAMPRLVPVLLLSALFAAGVQAAEPLPADPLRAVLLESKEKNRGVTVHVNGSNIGMVVTGVDDQYVTGRSQTTSRIVIRVDRIDGVSAMF